MKQSKILFLLGIAVLIILSLVGWYILFVQKPDVLAAARVRYMQAVQKHQDLSNGPCLGKIADDWVLDIAHVPRQTVDDLPQNQCTEFRTGQIHHFVEMSPAGEVITVH